MTGAQPDRDVAAFLSTAASPPAGFTPVYAPSGTGSNIYASLVLPANVDGQEGGIPSQAVFVVVTGGPPPTPYAGMGESFSEYSVQVRVRSNPDDYQGGLAIARWVQESMHLATVPCAATAGDYVGCWAMQADPLPLGADTNNRYEWSLNFRLPLATTP